MGVEKRENLCPLTSLAFYKENQNSKNKQTKTYNQNSQRKQQKGLHIGINRMRNMIIKNVFEKSYVAQERPCLALNLLPIIHYSIIMNN